MITISYESTRDLGQAFALAVALRKAKTRVRVTGAGKGEVVVIAGEFYVAMNGEKPRRHSDIDAVIRAVAKS